MSGDFIRYPLLDKLYQQYLTDEHSADFIQWVSRSYSIGSLERLARNGQPCTRRAAVLALGFLGDFSVNETMGRALNDDDRGVRMLADHGIRSVWTRQGNHAEQAKINQMYAWSSQNRNIDVIESATILIESNPSLAEAWNHRAIAFSAEGQYESAIEDCKETLNCNRFHFPAAIGLAHCCLQLDDHESALDGFRLALRMNPDLEGVRQHVMHLEKILED